MAPHRDLAKIGSDGFALIDEYFDKKRTKRAAPTTVAGSTFQVTQQSFNYHYSSLKTHVYRIIPPSRSESIITVPTPPAALNSYEAAKLHDGIHLANYSNRRQMHIAY